MDGEAPNTAMGGGMTYLSTLLGSLKKGSEEKRAREGKKIEGTAGVVAQQKQQADQSVQALASSGKTGSPEYDAAVQKLADANKAYDDVLKSMSKFYQPEKAMWERAVDVIKRAGGKKAPQAGAQPAPQPGGAAPSAVNAQQPDVYGAVARAQAGTMQQEGQQRGLQRKVDMGELQAKLRAQGASEEQAGGVAKIITTHQMLSRDPNYSLDQALRDVQDGAMKATGGKFGAGQQAAIELLQRARLDPRFKDRIPEIDQKIAALGQGLTGGLGYAKQATQKYPTGKEIEAFRNAGVATKPYDQVTPQEWDKIFAFAKKDYAEKTKEHEARMRNASASHDHRYQEFQARTAGDRAILGRLQGRVGQLEALLANPDASLDEGQKATYTQELINTQAQATDIYENVKTAYGDIYKPAAQKATPRLGPPAGLSSEGQKYFDGIKQ